MGPKVTNCLLPANGCHRLINQKTKSSACRQNYTNHFGKLRWVRRSLVAASSLFEAGDHDVDEATANVLFVKLLTRTLDIFHATEEDEREACLLALTHLDYNVFVAHVEVCEEVLHVLQSGLVRDSAQLDTPVQIFLV